MRKQNINREYPLPNDLNIGQLSCSDCKYNYTCENVNEDCAANCVFNNKICHYKNCVITHDNNNRRNYINVITIDDVIGKKIVGVYGGKPGDDTFSISFEDGTSIMFYHEQDCCERVSIDDVCGDIKEMVGQKLLKCSYTTNHDESAKSEYDDSYTWTFYHFATRKGYVDMKWYGTSNGYYSEYVNYKIYDKNGDVINEHY